MVTLTLADAAKILKEIGLELPTSDRVEFLHGLEVESERLDSLGGDWTAVGHVVLDHLREDRAYYRKLKKALREHYDEQAERAAWQEAHEAGRARSNPDKSSDPTVVEYAMRMMQKGKSPKQAAAATKKKLHGGENLMLGPGTVEIDERALEEALYARILESAQYGLSRGWTPEDAVRGALQGTCYSSFDDKTLALVEQTIPEVVKRMHRKNPSVKLSEAALSALEVYVTDPAFIEADPTDDEGIVAASRQILESLNGSTLTTPDASDPERCWAWHARFSYAAESAMESDDHGAAKSLNALASKCIDPLRKQEAATKTRKNPSANRAAFSISIGDDEWDADAADDEWDDEDDAADDEWDDEDDAADDEWDDEDDADDEWDDEDERENPAGLFREYAYRENGKALSAAVARTVDPEIRRLIQKINRLPFVHETLFSCAGYGASGDSSQEHRKLYDIYGYYFGYFLVVYKKTGWKDFHKALLALMPRVRGRSSAERNWQRAYGLPVFTYEFHKKTPAQMKKKWQAVEKLVDQILSASRKRP